MVAIEQVKELLAFRNDSSIDEREELELIRIEQTSKSLTRQFAQPDVVGIQ